MKIKFKGTGTVNVDGTDVKSGAAVEVDGKIGAALIRQDPRQWEKAEQAPRVCGIKKGGR